MTIKELLDAIAEALFQEFGSGYEIYSEKVEQGLTEPCFMIRCLNPTKNRHLGLLYKRTNQISIQYIPSTDEIHDECNSVMERLFDCLKSVNLSGRFVHGTDIQGQVTDDVLNVTVNYDCFVLEGEDKFNMEDLEILTEAKG